MWTRTETGIFKVVTLSIIALITADRDAFPEIQAAVLSQPPDTRKGDAVTTA
jgi:hypothetical protein